MKEVTQKIYRQDGNITNTKSTLIGSSLVIVAAILPALDRILVWIWPALDTIRDLRGVKISVDIWQGSLYAAPVCIAIAAFYRPHKKLYYFPITMSAYGSIIYFAPIFGYDVHFMEWNSWLAGLISMVATLPIMKMLQNVKYLSLVETSDDDFYDDVLEKMEELHSENEELKQKLKSQSY